MASARIRLVDGASSSASERLMAMRAEYALLHGRFKDELARQAEKAAESAKEAAAAAKRSERAVRKARAAAAATVMAAAQTPQDTDTGAAVKSPSPAKASGKKKKRSALANASNPHHLRNYVPSRIPNQGHLNAAQLGTNAQNLLSPLPLLFLSAQIPPRRGAAVRPLAAASQLANPAEEWICPSCEYRLFYGDEQAYRTGVRNRKKILKRRRRARERAAAAANGSGTGVGVAAGGKGSVVDDEEDLDFETGGSGLAPEPTRFAGGGEGRRFEGGGGAGG
ncbi:hypothetical protein BC834DRAFT_856696 [Gloeopeniophorella convolvens]|nr:hypothetical protein BC834DRAFT_856696 [Gloeopeniophorella convolvens]